MTRAEITTVSPGPTDTSLCSSTAMSERADSGSPWLPDTRRAMRSGAAPGSAAAGAMEDSGMRSSPRSIATSALSTIRRPRNPTRRPASRARSATLWIRGTEVAKHDTSTRPRGALEHVSERGNHRVLAVGMPPALDVRAVGEEDEHAALAPRREGLEVGALLLGRRGVDLEVAAGEDHASGSLDGEGEAVDHAVRHPDRMHPERAELHGLARCQQPEVGGDSPLLQPLPRVAQREAAAVDGRRRGLERKGERADVVLVTMGEEDAAQASGPPGEVLEVRYDRVDARHLGAREHHSRVHEQQMLLPLEEQRVHAELSQPPEGDETDAGLRRSAVHGPLH